MLQHIGNLNAALSEFARVTVPGGRIVVVEPDNAARYWFSSLASGRDAAVAAKDFFSALAEARAERSEAKVGPRVPVLMPAHGIEPLDVRLFPVSQTQLGAPAPTLWEARRNRIEQTIAAAPAAARRPGTALLDALGRYAAEADQAGPSFVEIQLTMLFATVGQKVESA